ncbi:hypothetical protein [Amycolatopsis keratiniphila]|uniref:Uncharacterized protein n=1 Tax=Amycolatopsis keratiniphila subsp. keratiniphila TaxID=227715 RepID=A0A1W2M475_9PSEU|nr:hypothetical protein [Amycolatopsis keratiniphila]ONF75011.1 hypothetical protein AVR91_0200370 [Amycolatopsis keratiniphila subsp. keratiniphila]
MLTRARVTAALAATGLAIGAMGLMTPSAAAATAAGSERQSSPLGNNGCHTDPADGGFYCTIFDIAPVAKPVLDVAVGLTCLNKEAEDFILCISGQ